MIRRRVSAALLLRDGFTGFTLSPAAAILCRLDGRAIRTMRKNDGYLVLVDLEPGDHTLSITVRGYREEVFPFTVPAQGALEAEIALTPGAGYRFPADTACLRVTVPGGAGELLWAAQARRDLVKLGQGKKNDPPTSIRLFCSGNPARLPVPGPCLALDEKGPEVVRLTALQTESGELAEPFAKSHPRGTELRPARAFRMDGEGKTELLFPQGGEVFLFCREQWLRTELQPGTQDLAWPDSP